MYVCMYVYFLLFKFNIRIFTYTYIYIYAYIKLYVYTCVRVYTFIYAHILGVKYMWCMSINMLFWSLLYFYRSSIFFYSSPSSSGSFVFGSDLFIKQAACQGSLCTQCTPSQHLKGPWIVSCILHYWIWPMLNFVWFCVKWRVCVSITSVWLPRSCCGFTQSAKFSPAGLCMAQSLPHSHHSWAWRRHKHLTLLPWSAGFDLPWQWLKDATGA